MITVHTDMARPGPARGPGASDHYDSTGVRVGGLRRLPLSATECTREELRAPLAPRLLQPIGARFS